MRSNSSSLATLLGLQDSYKPPKFYGKTLALRNINVLVQTRRTFDDIEELAIDIAEKGLLEPLIVAMFDSSGLNRYLTALNLLWGKDYSLKDLKKMSRRNKGSYAVLVAGERRFRAIKLNLSNNPTAPKVVDVRICEDIAPVEALYIQLSENTHKSVPPHEEARAYSQVFRMIRQVKPNFSIAAFARHVGRSPETIKRALRFCDLPEDIQQATEKRLIPYGIAVELSRLQEAGISTGEIRNWLLIAIATNRKVENFRQQVSKRLDSSKVEQGSFLGLLETDEHSQQVRRHIKQVVEGGLVRNVWMANSYMERLKRLYEDGALGLISSPFSERSPTKVFRALAARLEEVLPHLKKNLTKRELPKYEKLFREVENATRLMEKEKTPDPTK